MSWFEDQLHSREESDNIELSDAVDSLANAIMGKRLKEALSQSEISDSAIELILKYYHCDVKSSDFSPKFDSIEEQIEYKIRPYGIKSRTVTLQKGWYRNAVGAMIGTLKDSSSAVALIPDTFSGYKLINVKDGTTLKLNKKTEQFLDDEAVCFYEPLAQKSLTIKDLFIFMLKQLSVSDIVLYLILMGLTTALGLLSPQFTKWLFGSVLESKNVNALIALAVFMICFSLSRLCMNSFSNLIGSRIGIKQNTAVGAAVMNRILSLPPSFFRDYSSGELAQRASYVESLCSTLFETIGVSTLTSVFSLVYIGQIFVFAKALVAPALLVTLATIVLSLITTFTQMKISKKQMEISAKTSGLTYSAITGIQKIKLSGSEKRAYSRWARMYSQEAALAYNPPLFLKLSGPLHLTLSLLGSLVIYAVAIKSHVSVSDYYAFNTAYGMVTGAFMSVVSIALSIANILPTLEMAKPIMEAIPESHDNKELITELNGSIEFSHVSFRYNEQMPNVIDDLSLKIKPGEYLAIAGATGCGKSTLLRLLLGFETPQKGMITYDRKDLSKIDLESLRSKIGVVLQDGKLFLGDIYSNIVITSPALSVADAWEAASIASLDDDIRSMPMGMFTMISEGQGGISGGQKQRLMIARAVAPKPRILMFDEATSALDNITQKKVTEAIDVLKCTRIVIAHRLSTIQKADRIIFLEGGKITEEGTYEELIAKNGSFADLVKRQRLDDNTIE